MAKLGKVFLAFLPLQQAAPPCGLSASTPHKEIILVSVSDSASTTHDSMRAGFGIYLTLSDIISNYSLPITLSYYDGATFRDNSSAIESVLGKANTLLMGSETWLQGPPSHLRAFIENFQRNIDLNGVAVSAWATSGGAFTGGEVVVNSIYRSLLGVGGTAFTLYQKEMVFTMEERDGRYLQRCELIKKHEFTPLDCYFMDQFSRVIAVNTLMGGSKETAKCLASVLQSTQFYYDDINPDKIQVQFAPLQELLNAAADGASQEWKKLTSLLSSP